MEGGGCGDGYEVFEEWGGEDYDYGWGVGWFWVGGER